MAGSILVKVGSIRVSVESVALLCASVDLRVQLISVDFGTSVGFSRWGSEQRHGLPPSHRPIS